MHFLLFHRNLHRTTGKIYEQASHSIASSRASLAQMIYHTWVPSIPGVNYVCQGYPGLILIAILWPRSENK